MRGRPCLLVDRLEIPWAHAYDQACKLEHILSDQVADALEEFLGHPATCPHGQPIPDRQGGIAPQRETWPLASVQAVSSQRASSRRAGRRSHWRPGRAPR
ncbi:MAG: hypothetical protein EOM08_15180, partial [Clostridia bacterium]|nr:hypothetical protein [Clostridia bacterium]